MSTYTQDAKKAKLRTENRLDFCQELGHGGKQGDVGQDQTFNYKKNKKSGDLVYIMVYLKAAGTDHQCLPCTKCNYVRGWMC